MDEVIEITDYIQNEAGDSADIIWGNGTDESLENNISITLIATGFKSKDDQIQEKNRNKKVHILSDETGKVAEKNKTVNKKIENIELIRNKEVIETAETKITASKPVSDFNNDESENTNTFIFDFTEPSTVNKKEKFEVHENEIKFETSSELNTDSNNNDFSNNDKQELQKTISTKSASHEDKVEQKSVERINKLKALSIKLKSSEGIAQLENEPAYLRKKIKLENNTSSDSNISRFSLSDNKEQNETSIKQNNSFLHDNVD